MVTVTVLYTLVVFICALPLGVFLSYLLVMLIAASHAARKESFEEISSVGGPRRKDTPSLGTVVIIPAHNEEKVLAATLESLQKQDYPHKLTEILVVADNCTDSTARIGKQYGATVLERCDADNRGKGYALDFAISKLLERQHPPDAFVIVDADTWVAPNFLTLMMKRMEAGLDDRKCCALQGRYGVLNAENGWRAALMSAAFDLYNHVRPAGCARLGLSVSLKGNGMAFSREVVRRAQWRGHITEDVDYGLDLIVNHNIRVGYVPSALVLAQMPETASQAASQRSRWEEGRYHLLRNRALPLLLNGLRTRSLVLCDAACTLVIPPLAELTAMLVVGACLVAIGARMHILADANAWIAAYAAAALAMVMYVLWGLRIAGASPRAYSALVKAPLYIVWKFALYALRIVRRAVHRSDPQWIRTERLPLEIDH